MIPCFKLAQSSIILKINSVIIIIIIIITATTTKQFILYQLDFHYHVSKSKVPDLTILKRTSIDKYIQETRAVTSKTARCEISRFPPILSEKYR